MSSPIALRWRRGTRRRTLPATGPSLREVRLVGDARPAGAVVIGETVRRGGRTYRVAEAQISGPSDPRRYLHLVALVPSGA